MVTRRSMCLAKKIHHAEKNPPHTQRQSNRKGKGTHVTVLSAKMQLHVIKSNQTNPPLPPKKAIMLEIKFIAIMNHSRLIETKFV